MRAGLPYNGEPDDHDAIRAEYHRLKLDSLVASAWRFFWWVLAILALGELARWFG
jgi:hypothetical protein